MALFRPNQIQKVSGDHIQAKKIVPCSCAVWKPSILNLCLIRGEKIHASKLRPLDYIEVKGKSYEVVKAESISSNRIGFVQLELKDVHKGTKYIPQKMNSGDIVDTLDVESFTGEYIGVSEDDEDVLIFEQAESEEEIEINKEVFGESFKYLQEGAKVLFKRLDEKIIKFVMPATIEATVLETTGGSKPATLSDGLFARVPTHVKVGDRIIIRTEDGTYVSRSN